MIITGFCCAALVMVGGCGDETVSRAISDPADVTISSASLEIGVNDEIMLPGWATRLANGNIAVADAYLQAVVFFDTTGREIRRSGRRGFGPGEYQDLGWLAQCGQDSLYVFDPMQGRITVIDTAGTAGRQFIAPRASKLDCRNGSMAALMMPEVANRPDPSRPRERFKSSIQFFDLDGKAKAEVENVPVGEYGPLARVSGIALTDDRLWFGSADSAFLDTYTHKGKRGMTVGFGMPGRNATEHHRASDIEQQIKGFRDKGTRDGIRNIMNKFATSELLPSFKQIVADPDGNVWIATSFPGDSTTDLRVIDGNGAPLADVKLSRRIQIFEIGRDYILGSDEVDDQPRVVLYSFDPAILKSAAN